MPVPFSFSTQRPTSEADAAFLEDAAVLGDLDVQQQPNGSPFEAKPPTSNAAKAPTPFALRPHGVFQPANFSIQAHVQPAPQSPSPTTREIQAVSLTPTTHLFQPVNLSAAPDVVTTDHELTVYIEQLRNDLFSAATNISALSDRLERLESRPATSAAFQTELATLRSDIERWITHHLEAAVEQSMRRIWERSHAASSLL